MDSPNEQNATFYHELGIETILPLLVRGLGRYGFLEDIESSVNTLPTDEYRELKPEFAVFEQAYKRAAEICRENGWDTDL